MPSAPLANLINACLLIAMSGWGFLAADKVSYTALIPAAFGVALLLCQPGVKSENKVIAHIAVLLTLVVFIALFMPLHGALSDGRTLGAIRVGLMMLTSLIAMIAFIGSFRAARKAREAA
ncbi:MAG: hypothetical protein AAGI28_17390, partial [Pseudomonadota bacterium]